jgi:magnesium-transporting ATPase (P-type)
VILSTVSLIFYAAWSRRHYTSLDYICLDPEAPDTSFYNRKNCGGSEAEASILGMWVTFFTLFNNFVPISLYVTLEMVNYIQAYYIDTDIQVPF